MRRMADKSDNIQKTALRLPKELHARIREAAEENGRSFNSEIIERLKRSFQETSPEVAQIADVLAGRILAVIEREIDKRR